MDALVKIARSEGWLGLYSGLGSGVIGTTLSQGSWQAAVHFLNIAGIYYYWYRLLHTFIQKSSLHAKLGALESLLVPALGKPE